MGVKSDGSYGIKEGLVFSFPVTVNSKRQFSIVQNLSLTTEIRDRLEVAQVECVKDWKEKTKDVPFVKELRYAD